MKIYDQEKERLETIRKDCVLPDSDRLFLLRLVDRALHERVAPSTPVEHSEEQKYVIRLLRSCVREKITYLNEHYTTVLIGLIDDLHRRARSAPPDTPPKPKIVFYDYLWDKSLCIVMYVAGKKVQTFGPDVASVYVSIGPTAYKNLWAKDLQARVEVLQALGYEVEVRSVKREDMPPDPKTNERGQYAPDSLTELEDHFKNLETSRRRERIAALEAELAQLKKGLGA